MRLLAPIAAGQEAEEGKGEHSIGFLSPHPTFIHSVSSAHKMVPPNFKANSMSSVNSVWENPERHIQRYILPMSWGGGVRAHLCGKQRLIPNIFLHYSQHGFLSVGLSLNPEIMDLARLAG